MADTQHDIERLIERSSVEGVDGVPIAVRRSAFDAVANHPSFAEALAAPVCVAVVILEPKSFFEQSRWSVDTKAKISRCLHDVESVILLSFMTSDIDRTEHFSGGGVSYDFVIHPRTYSLIHATLGSWRT